MYLLYKQLMWIIRNKINIILHKTNILKWDKYIEKKYLLKFMII